MVLLGVTILMVSVAECDAAPLGHILELFDDLALSGDTSLT